MWAHLFLFYFIHGFGKEPDSSPSRRGGSVPAVLFHFEHEIGVALFACTDERYLFVDAEHFTIQNGAAFVDDVFKPDSLRFKIFTDFQGAVGAAEFLVVSEAKEYRAAWFSPLFQQNFQPFKRRYHLRLHVLRAPAVDVAVADDSSERIDFPTFLVGGDDVLMRQNGGGEKAFV